jgi:hypothetical protein
MRYIVEADIPALCDWLDVKLEGRGDLLSPVFAAETRTADLLVKVGPGRLLHTEYVRSPESDMFARMVGYRAHIMRQYPGMSLTQYAIVLGRGRLVLRDDAVNGFYLGLRVVYLSETDPSEVLARPNLAALSILTKGDQQDRAESVLKTLRLLRTFPLDRRRGLLEAMTSLATISLDRSTIDLITKELKMTVESVAEFYSETDLGRAIGKQAHEQGLEQGLEQGREQGRQQELTQSLIDLLRVRFGIHPQIPALAEHLAHESDRAARVRAITEAETLDDLLDRMPHDS